MPELNEPLSERELDILRLVATGAANKEIAQQLFISANTVKVHLRNIFAKIGVASRTEATLYAIRAGLVVLEGSAADRQASDTPPIVEQSRVPDEANLSVSESQRAAKHRGNRPLAVFAIL